MGVMGVCVASEPDFSIEIKWFIKGFHISLKADILFLCIAVIFSIVTYSIRRFVQWLMCKPFLDFQFKRTIFFVIVNKMSHVFLCLSWRLSIFDIFPNKHGNGHVWILQLKIVESCPEGINWCACPSGVEVIIYATRGALRTYDCVG